MDAIECIKTRRSVRSYLEKQIPKTTIEDIIDCGRLAPSARNTQPWEFVIVTDRDRLVELADATDHGKFIAESSACVAVFCENGKYYLEDGSAATTNIVNAAHAHGVQSCWVAGDKKAYAEKVNKILNAPKNMKLVSLIALGYSESKAMVGKRNLAEVMHWENYNLR